MERGGGGQEQHEVKTLRISRGRAARGQGPDSYQQPA